MKKYLSLMLIFPLALALVIPARAAGGPVQQLAEPPVAVDAGHSAEVRPNAGPELQTPSQEEIRAKWETVTYATSLYATDPSVSAPYATGRLSDNFLESGITYLNYVRFVAGLPEVVLDGNLNDKAQHGAVLLAAIDDLTHYPPQPADMDGDFYDRGYAATTSSNLSARKGYNPLSCLQGAVHGCMDDSGDNNLAALGHRRWLLNPSLGKVGFGYAQSDTGWSYIVTPVFDYSGTGCSYDFIGWPVAGNHPTNLFGTEVPWSLTLNPSVYQYPDLNSVQITITRESDGRQWHFDSTTGGPTTNTEAYMTVNNQGYGVSSCIIFHPGSRNVEDYAGTFRVDVSGIYLRNGTETSLTYNVNFFDVEAVCTGHSYQAVVTEPTCQEEGYTTFTCSLCGDSYVDFHVGVVDHSYEDGHCKWCGEEQAYVKWSSISTSLGGNIAMNFYVELSEDLVADPDAYIRFSFAGRTIQVPLSEGKEAVKNGVTVYQFSCPITSKNMTDEITAQVYNANGAVGDPKTMAVDTYCNWVIENYKDEKTVNLMKAMLNYGASAQLLFKYRTDDLANASLDASDKVFGAVDASGYKHSVVGTEEGIIAKSMTLLLDSETTVRVYFELTGDKSIEDYKFTVDGVEVQATYKDGKYYIEKQNIAAHRLDDMHIFTCGGITVTYGGLSYVNQVMTYYTSGTTFDMASALYAYSKAAEAYIG